MSAVLDVEIMVGRGLRHLVRGVDALLVGVLMPVMILLAFTYVFGGAIDPAGGYLDYVVPGIVILCASYGCASTAVAVTQDMTTGVVDRFRSLPIAGSSVLAGHVVAAIVRTIFSTALVVLIAVALGFRPVAGPLEWLAVLGILAVFMAGVAWVAAAAGLLARSAEAAGAFSFVVLFLPYVSSAFVPPETMPGFLRAVALHQPVTPLADAVRGLLLGTPTGTAPLTALAWGAGLVVAGITACSLLFRRRATSAPGR